MQEKKDSTIRAPCSGAGPSTKHCVPSVPCTFADRSASLGEKEQTALIGTVLRRVQGGLARDRGWGRQRTGTGICAGWVPVALSWPLLSPHPLPLQCRERGVAAFAGEMADDEVGGESPLEESRV
jgi:hypothetical protein